MRAKAIVLLVAGLLYGAMVLPSAHAVKLYKWVDKDGRVSYQDRPPPEEGQRVESRDFKVGNTPRPSGDQGASAAEQYPVVLYTAPQCTACDLARAYLDRRKVPFTDKNVSASPEALQELREKSGALTVPTIAVGPKVMRGYLESLLSGELDAAGYPKIETPAPTEEQQQAGEPAAPRTQ